MRAELMRGTSWAAAAAWLAVAAPAWAAAPPLPGSTVPGQAAPGGGGTTGNSAGVLSGADVVEGAATSPFPAAGEVRLGQLGYPYTSVAGPAAEPAQRGRLRGHRHPRAGQVHRRHGWLLRGRESGRHGESETGMLGLG